jgi:DNA-directed RNA polymerase specialized sigma24 family protein
VPFCANASTTSSPRSPNRQVVVWRLELGFTPQEIANRLGKSEGAAAMTVSRAMARLAKELEAQNPPSV